MMHERKARAHGVVCVAALAALAAWPTGCKGAEGTNFHAVVIQGAGYEPGGKAPEGTDAITHATTPAINTYTLTKALSAKLAAHAVAVRVVQWAACKELGDLEAAADGSRPRADLVVFAGPSHFSKQPAQLMALYPKLKEAVRRNPRLVASALVPAWYPADKGQAALKEAEKAFTEAGARSVPGVTLLTPRDNTPGASAEEVDKALAEFAARLAAALEQAR